MNVRLKIPAEVVEKYTNEVQGESKVDKEKMVGVLSRYADAPLNDGTLYLSVPQRKKLEMLTGGGALPGIDDLIHKLEELTCLRVDGDDGPLLIYNLSPTQTKRLRDRLFGNSPSDVLKRALESGLFEHMISEG